MMIDYNDFFIIFMIFFSIKKINDFWFEIRMMTRTVTAAVIERWPHYSNNMVNLGCWCYYMDRFVVWVCVGV